MGLVKIRVSGTLAEIDAIQSFICDAEAVMNAPRLLSASSNYPNKDGSEYRRYLDLLVELDPVVQEATLVNPQLSDLNIKDLPMDQ